MNTQQVIYNSYVYHSTATANTFTANTFTTATFTTEHRRHYHCHHYHQVGQQQKIYGQHVFFYLMLTYCVLPEMSTKLAGVLPVSCDSIPGPYDGYELDDDGQIHYLRNDPSTDCGSKQYKSMIVLWILLALVYLSFWLSHACLLLYYRHRILLIDDECLELRHATLYDPQIKALKFLISPYKRTVYYYDIYDMLRSVF